MQRSVNLEKYKEKILQQYEMLDKTVIHAVVLEKLDDMKQRIIDDKETDFDVLHELEEVLRVWNKDIREMSRNELIQKEKTTALMIDIITYELSKSC